jgi:hypothetical protein
MLAIAPRYNTHGKKDAREFQRCARIAAEEMDGEVFLFDNHAPFPQRRKEVLKYIRQGEGQLCLFMHGWRTGIQAGFRIADIRSLAKAINIPLDGYYRYQSVTLFACLCAHGPRNGEKSFASRLSQAIPGVIVYAHTTKGHTAWNPHVIGYDGLGNGGYYVVPMDSPKWPAWKGRLREGLWSDLPKNFPWEIAGMV